MKKDIQIKSERRIEDLPSSCIKNVIQGSWVCWETFAAEPLNISLLHFQTHSKGHLG
jgi:hypothetical protein